MTATTTASVRSLAKQAAQSFEAATRGDTGKDEDRYVRVTAGSPEWVTEMVQDAHDGMFPDDWKYAAISAACEAIADNDDDEPGDAGGFWADSYVDVYNSDRIAWLASSVYRQGYCTDAADEYETESHDIIELIGLGQYYEASQVYCAVLNYLTDKAAA